MQIHNSLERLPALHNPVITMGSFDGVHLGHRQVLRYLKQCAAERGGESVVITFDPHPQQVLHPEKPFLLIHSLEDKVELLEQEGIEHLIIIPFTLEFAEISFSDFFQMLINKIGLKAIVMGQTHNFGKNREGNKETIQEMCRKNDVEPIIIPEFILNEVKVHSSEIRKHIINKDFNEAERLLGHPLKKK